MMMVCFLPLIVRCFSGKQIGKTSFNRDRQNQEDWRKIAQLTTCYEKNNTCIYVLFKDMTLNIGETG